MWTALQLAPHPTEPAEHLDPDPVVVGFNEASGRGSTAITSCGADTESALFETMVGS